MLIILLMKTILNGVGSHDGENYFTVTDVNAPDEVMYVPSDAEKSDLVYQDHRWHLNQLHYT